MVIYVQVRPIDGKFRVLVNGWMEYWTIDQIKDAVAKGADLREWA